MRTYLHMGADMHMGTYMCQKIEKLLRLFVFAFLFAIGSKQKYVPRPYRVPVCLQVAAYSAARVQNSL